MLHLAKFKLVVKDIMLLQLQEVALVRLLLCACVTGNFPNYLSLGAVTQSNRSGRC